MATDSEKTKVKKEAPKQKWFEFNGTNLDIEHWANLPKGDFKKQFEGKVRFDIDNTYNRIIELAKENGYFRSTKKVKAEKADSAIDNDGTGNPS